jgi:hypothetical protein
MLHRRLLRLPPPMEEGDPWKICTCRAWTPDSGALAGGGTPGGAIWRILGVLKVRVIRGAVRQRASGAIPNQGTVSE